MLCCVVLDGCTCGLFACLVPFFHNLTLRSRSFVYLVVALSCLWFGKTYAYSSDNAAGITRVLLHVI